MTTVGNLIVKVGADTSALHRGLSDAEGRVGGFANRISGTMGAVGKTAFLGIAAGSVAAFGAAAGGMAIASRSAMGFEQSMANVGATMRASEEEMALLNETALRMGKETSFSAKEAGDAMYFLASAGYDAQQSSESLPGLLSLAAATATDLATSADIATNVLSAFGGTAEETGYYSDVLAATVSKSNTNLTQLGDAMKYVAPTAAAMGFDVADAAAAIGTLSDSGIQASSAGTALRSIMSRLAAPTGEAASAIDELGISLFDAEGNLKSMPQIVDEFNGALDGMTSSQQQAALKTIFGQEAMGSFQVLMNKTGEDLGKFGDTLRSSVGIAGEMAADQLDTATGSLLQFKGSLETILIKLGKGFTPLIKEAGLAATAFLNESVMPLVEAFVAALPGALEKGQELLGNFISILKNPSPGGGFIPAILDLIESVGELLGVEGEKLQGFISRLGTVMGDIQGVFNGVVAGFEKVKPVLATVWNSLMEGGKWVYENFGTVRDIVLGVVAAFGTFTVLTTVAGWISTAVAAFGAISTVVASAGGIIGTVVAILGGPLTIVLGAVALAVGALAAAWAGNWFGIRDKTQVAIDAIKGFVDAGLTFINNFWATHGETIKSTVKSTWENLKGAIQAGLETIRGAVSSVLGKLEGFWDTHGEAIKQKVQALWDGLKGIFQWGVDLLKNIAGLYTAYQEGEWKTFGGKLRDIWDMSLGRIVSLLDGAVQSLVSTFENFRKPTQQDWENFGDSLKNTWAKMWESIKNKAAELIPQIETAIRNLVSNIKNFFTETDWGAIGAAIIDGLKAGLESKVDGLLGRASEIASNISSIIKGALRIESPSKVMKKIGAFVIEGLRIGLDPEPVYKAARAIAEAIKSPISGLSGPSLEPAGVGALGGPLAMQTEPLPPMAADIAVSPLPPMKVEFITSELEPLAPMKLGVVPGLLERVGPVEPLAPMDLPLIPNPLGSMEAAESVELRVIEPTLEAMELRMVKPPLEPMELRVASPTLEQMELKLVKPALEQMELKLVKPALEQMELKVAKPTLEPMELKMAKPSLEPMELKMAKPSLEPMKLQVIEPALEAMELRVRSPKMEPLTLQEPRIGPLKPAKVEPLAMPTFTPSDQYSGNMKPQKASNHITININVEKVGDEVDYYMLANRLREELKDLI